MRPRSTQKCRGTMGGGSIARTPTHGPSAPSEITNAGSESAPSTAVKQDRRWSCSSWRSHNSPRIHPASARGASRNAGPGDGYTSLTSFVRADHSAALRPGRGRSAHRPPTVATTRLTSLIAVPVSSRRPSLQVGRSVSRLALAQCSFQNAQKFESGTFDLPENEWFSGDQDPGH